MSKFSRQSLHLDLATETERIVNFMQETVHHKFRRQGGVVGISGGIDSSVCLALAAKAFGPERVVGIMLPEKESSPDSAMLATKLAERFGVQTLNENISGALDGFGCYQRRDEAIQRVIPEYRPGYAMKIVLPTNLLEKQMLNIFRVVVTAPDGTEYSKRLPLNEYMTIVAASNFKQRSRMSLLYFHAEARNYAVIGTPNKNERDLGFFVKWGDGGADIFPIGHLYKTQVFQLAAYLGVPEEICERTPTTDTYPGGQTQEEFFYRIPFDLLDTIWYGYEQGVSNEDIAAALDLTAEQVAHVVADIESKKRTTEFLRTPPVSYA
ncbi:MAG: NAD(+) synthase [Chloroflexota bacterium]